VTEPNGLSGASDLAPSSAWDAFVEASEPGSYLELSAWATVKAANGWAAHRIVADGAPDGPIGAQVLVRRPRPMPWAFAYAPRGPVSAAWTPGAIEAFTERIRVALPSAAGRVSHMRIDPEIEADGPHDLDGSFRRALRAADWRRAPAIQPASTRVIDLRADEAALWGDLRKKWRQYVNKARAGGVVVVDADGDRLGEFYRIYQETAARAGFLIRTEGAYRDVWDAYRPAGRARLLFAQTADGEPVATLFLVRSGPRVVEPYGGMTASGADSRANYLLKWEAIRTSREQGATSYDLWGLATGGIAHFKTGFGGREVRYIGAWDLVLDPLGRQAYEAALKARVRWARWRHGRKGATGASGFAGTAAGAGAADIGGDE
jgi:peptidoglycan pentaglycine glycine transferase (the first glycine)